MICARCLASGLKYFFDVGLAESLAQIVVDGFGATLPARLQDFLSAESLAIESEIFVQERRGKMATRWSAPDASAGTSFQSGEAFFVERLAHRLKEAGRADIQRRERRHSDLGEINLPLEFGSDLLEVLRWSSCGQRLSDRGVRRASWNPWPAPVSIRITVCASLAAVSGLSPRSSNIFCTCAR